MPFVCLHRFNEINKETESNLFSSFSHVSHPSTSNANHSKWKEIMPSDFISPQTWIHFSFDVLFLFRSNWNNYYGILWKINEPNSNLDFSNMQKDFQLVVMSWRQTSTSLTLYHHTPYSNGRLTRETGISLVGQFPFEEIRSNSIIPFIQSHLFNYCKKKN